MHSPDVCVLFCSLCCLCEDRQLEAFCWVEQVPSTVLSDDACSWRYLLDCNGYFCCSSITQINFSLFKLVESINLQSTGSGSTFWFAIRSSRLHAVSCCSVCGYKIEYTKTMQMQLALGLDGLRLRLRLKLGVKCAVPLPQWRSACACACCLLLIGLCIVLSSATKMPQNETLVCLGGSVVARWFLALFCFI